MSLIHIDHPNIPVGIRAAFAQKVTDIAAGLQIDPNWLMQVMYAESKLKASAQNIQKGRLIAAGLLQWTSASGAPGAPQSMLQRNHLQQLDWVKEYFKPYRGKMHSYFDVYLVTFFPAAVGKQDNYVFSTSRLSASLIASQNPAVNIVKDGKITMAEFKQYVWNSTPYGVRGLVFKAQQVIQDVKQEAKDVITDIKDNTDTVAKAIGGIATIAAFFFSSGI
ncbi:hypothetical protein [Taibaiella soli]|uniref:Transglycosylase SLT domain-containing protein n=1 Tax=Taibaiella soli TaxID=1649169 RepID=A0A2W2AH73_9BACT|nr:hypothetical protein [Taibaiella soli]PZF71570.1 hypothetical protein DN068_15965 [Taibaiella soli]